jgi:(p)ppGpp synthase/HD superfamily hydrolase
MVKASVEQNDSLVARAATFAVRAHEGQSRKGTGFPYVTHPIGVAHILRDYYPDDEALEAAGYLHDVLEDTDFGVDALVERFGQDVAQLVAGVTNNGNWHLEDWIDNPRVLRLKAADTLDNVLDTIRGLEKGHDVWSRFAADKGKADTWKTHADLIYGRLAPDELASRLVSVVDRVVDLRDA